MVKERWGKANKLYTGRPVPRTLGSKAKSAGEEKNIASTMRRITRIEITKTQPIHSCPGAAKAPSARKASRSQ